MTSPDIKGKLAGVGLDLVLKMLVRSKIRGKSNFLNSAEHINSGAGGLVEIFNHLSMADLKVIEQLRSVVDQSILVAAFWGNKFTGIDAGIYDGEDLEKMRKFGQAGDILAQRKKIRLLALPQATVRDRELMDSGAEMIEEGKQIVRGGGAVSFAPEATRSRTGVLIRAKDAAANRLTRGMGEKVWVQPVGIVGSDQVLSTNNKLNPLKRMTAIYGQPITAPAFRQSWRQHIPVMEGALDENGEEFCWSPGDEAMWQIGQLLPQEMWGVYAIPFLKILASESGESLL